MKKKGILLLAAVMLMSFVLSGCGASLYEMTDGEEEIIIRYAAYALSKHNVYQKDGVRYLPESYLEAKEEPETETETETESETEEPEPSGVIGGEPGKAEQGNSVSLAKAIGYENTLDVTYEGFTQANVYQEDEFFSMTADAGKTYVIMNFRIVNKTQDSVVVDVLNKHLAFSASFDGGTPVEQELTLLLNDLSTYDTKYEAEGVLKAGESVEAVLLFQLPEAEAAQISDISLSVTKDGITNPIKL